MDKFEQELAALINRHSKENGSNTPDFILAMLLAGVLEAFNEAVRAREQWYGLVTHLEPAGIISVSGVADVPTIESGAG